MNTTEFIFTKDDLNTICEPWKAEIAESVALRTVNARPSTILVWTLGLSIVTFITLSAIVGIVLIRLVKQSTYSRLITFFVAVGVGSLSGSAVFHLLPQAYGLVDEFNPNSSHDYLPKAVVAVFGIYLFFIADKVIKIVLETRKRRKREQAGIHRRVSSSDHTHHLIKHNDGGCGADTPRSDGIQLEAIATNSAAEASIQQQAHSLCVHDHDMQYKKGDSVIAAVAWMIIFGDGLHNFIDGVSIGASFTESLLSGFSVSIAVIAEEFPHELGDVAILVSAGMTLRQALVYNLLSALSCYVGFAIGALFGNLDENFAPYIFAFAGGMFLYISISCMIPEMKKAMEEALQVSLKDGLEVLGLQTTGIFTGLCLMYTMARYGSSISISF